MAAQCLVWLPHSYAARGPAESCVRLAEHFPAAGFETSLFTVRNRVPLPDGLQAVEALGPLRSRVPYKYVRDAGIRRLEQLFAKAVSAAGKGAIAWFWPGAPDYLVEHAKSHGLITVREMINSPLAHAKPILDAAYRDAGLEPSHTITDALVAAENAELALYDYIFSSNAQVDAALGNLGIAPEKVLRSTFGWVGERFSHVGEDVEERPPFRACFVGLMNVRKGIPTLLRAWEAAGIDGELILAGTIEPCLADLVAQHDGQAGVRHMGYVEDVAGLYRSSDVFVFPTHEEGGPQVAYEAAACGAAVVTTDMGAARLIEDDVTGLIVPAGDPEALATALRRLADSVTERQRLSEAARAKVPQFEYAHVGRERAELLRSIAP